MNAVPVLSLVDFSGEDGRGLPLLLRGPSLGTSARNLWGHAAQALTERFRVIGWDLPGHGDSGPNGGFDLGQTRTVAQVRAAGMKVRRQVLGDPHVDRASANATEFTAEFQELITQYAWGSIWTRPGLDRRSRSLITLTALVARGHHEEFAMHVRAARNNGLSNDEIKELLLQTAIYCGVPDANTTFRIAQQVLADLDSAPTTTSDPNRDPDPNSES
jgi:4-carboxymuconolactone decarboxylase